MSDGELSKEEIEALLKPIKADDSTGSTKDVLTEDEINQLLSVILSGGKTELSAETVRKLETTRQGSGMKRTTILTSEEIDLLLKAINEE